MATLQGKAPAGFNNESRRHQEPLSKVDHDYQRFKKRGRLQDERPAKSISVQVLLADLKSCSKTKNLERGKEVHAKAVTYGHDSDIYVTSSLVSMYAKCGSMSDARRVFDRIQEPDVVCWNSLLLGYAENGEGVAALDLFSSMKASGYLPNFITYIAALKACASLALDGDDTGKKTCLECGRSIHTEIGNNINLYVQNTLIDMYAKGGSMVDARSVFDSMRKPDIVSWTNLLLGYAKNGRGLVALNMFSRMKVNGCEPDYVIYIAALKACTSLAVDGDSNVKKNCLHWGRKIHSEIGNHLNHYVHSTLIDMYAKCGSMVDARRVFESMEKPDVVCWNALLMGYAENGESLVALHLFSRMKASACVPNPVTYVAVLKSCTSLAVVGDVHGKKNCLERGREIHSEIGSNLDDYVQNTLIDMYAKGGSMAEARSVFESMQKPSIISWNALLLGYAENAEGFVVLDLFTRMKMAGCALNAVTYLAAIKACGSIGAFSLGRKLHTEITDFNAYLVTCLVDFYGKCGSMSEAQQVFDLHPKARDVTTWNALLVGYGRFGDINSVFNLFEAMQDEGFPPDAVTFSCLLSCCSHAGLVERAREYFKKMDVRYGVTPTVVHYNCMVDVLGRGNLLDEAVGLLQKMPCKPDAITWMSLLGACHRWKNVEMGKMAFQLLVDKNEKVASAHVLMAHIYGSNGMWEEQQRVLEGENGGNKYNSI